MDREPTRLKGAIFKRVAHGVTKREGVVRVNKDRMIFFAEEIDGDKSTPYFESKDGTEVERWLLNQLKRSDPLTDLAWAPIIKINVQEDADRWYRRDKTEESRDAGIKLDFDRFYIGLSHDQREWRKLKWAYLDPASAMQLKPEDRYAQSHYFDAGPKHPDLNNYKRAFALPKIDGERRYVAYTPELWAALVAIAKMVKAAGKEIDRLTSTKVGFEQLQAGQTTLRLTAKSSAT